MDKNAIKIQYFYPHQIEQSKKPQIVIVNNFFSQLI